MNQSVFPCWDVRTDRATLIGKPDSSSSVKAKAVSDIRDYKSSFSPASCSAERLLMIQFKSTSWNSRRRVGIKRKSAWNLEIPENNHWTHEGCSQHFSFCKILYCRGQPWCLGVYSKVTRGKPFFPCTALLHLYNPVLFARLCQHSNYKGPSTGPPLARGQSDEGGECADPLVMPSGWLSLQAPNALSPHCAILHSKLFYYESVK